MLFAQTYITQERLDDLHFMHKWFHEEIKDSLKSEMGVDYEIPYWPSTQNKDAEKN